jgi:hypothetical protein
MPSLQVHILATYPISRTVSSGCINCRLCGPPQFGSAPKRSLSGTCSEQSTVPGGDAAGGWPCSSNTRKVLLPPALLRYRIWAFQQPVRAPMSRGLNTGRWHTVLSLFAKRASAIPHVQSLRSNLRQVIRFTAANSRKSHFPTAVPVRLVEVTVVIHTPGRGQQRRV